jgi:hypothetical protein
VLVGRASPLVQAWDGTAGAPGGSGGQFVAGTFGAAGGPAGVSAVPAGAAPPAPKNTRFYGVTKINPERYSRDFNRLQQEIIQHLAAPEDMDLEISVEITARRKDGYPDDKVRIVMENVRTLKVEPFGFEDR